jgi:hypothetical protein
MRKFPDSFMVWGAVGFDVRTPLILCARSVTSAEYLSIIERSGLVELCDTRHGPGGWLFMQDGAPAHHAVATIATLSRLMRMLPGWPANRCDLNPIEMIWSIMGSKLAAVEWTNAAEMFAILQRIWDAMDVGMINRLVMDFRRRLELVVQVNGNSISALLSSHARRPRLALCRPGEFPEFTEAEDTALMKGVARWGRKWTRLPIAFPVLASRSPYELKQRHRCLDEHHQNLVRAVLLDEFGELAAEGTVVVDPPAQEPDDEEEEAEDEEEDGRESPPRPVQRHAGGREFMTFCLHERARVTAENPGCPPHSIARLLANEWRRLAPLIRADPTRPRVPQRPTKKPKRR